MAAMAHYQNQHNTTQTPTDEYGNPVNRTDEYGNPIQQGVTGATTGHGVHDTTHVTGTGYGTHSTDTSTGFVTDAPGGHGVSTLQRSRRSGSSSSSSSEDDGYGGRRKKGLKQKIKQKLPGDHKTDDPYGTTPTTTAYGGQHEEPGMMDKVKYKLPGGHKDEPYTTTPHTTDPYSAAQHTTAQHTTDPYTHSAAQHTTAQHTTDPYTHSAAPYTYSAAQHTTTTPGNGVAGEHHENKGVKLPCGDKDDPYSTTHTHTPTTAAPAYGTPGEHKEKGIMDKIKEKIPGGHSTTR